MEDSWIGRGGRRPVGVEVEFGELDAIGAAEAVVRRFGGEVCAEGAHRVRVEATEFGDFKVELDWDWIHAPSERSEEHTSELQSLMRISYAVLCLNKTTKIT